MDERCADEVPAKCATLTLLGIEAQENVYAAKPDMSDVVCIPLALPEIKFKLRDVTKAQPRKQRDIYATLPTYETLVDGSEVSVLCVAEGFDRGKLVSSTDHHRNQTSVYSVVYL